MATAAPLAREPTVSDLGVERRASGSDAQPVNESPLRVEASRELGRSRLPRKPRRSESSAELGHR